MLGTLGALGALVQGLLGFQVCPWLGELGVLEQGTGDTAARHWERWFETLRALKTGGKQRPAGPAAPLRAMSTKPAPPSSASLPS